jgi:poly(A) polymerase
MKESLLKFLPMQYVREIVETLAPYGDSRIVGGCVREIIRSHMPKDIDIAIQVIPEKAMELLSAKGYNCIPTGIQYGTITAVKNHYVFEITTLRADISTDGRRAVVKYTTDWVEDAKRRDFTFNAMYMDLDGNIYDYFGGQEDLDAKLVRFVGDPSERIREDYLRILRYFRFYSYIGSDNIDKQSLDACIALKDGLDILSSERLHIELFKMLPAPFAQESLILMCESGIMPHFIPTVNIQHIKPLKLSDNVIANFAAILASASIEKEAFKLIAKHFALSNKEKNRLITLLYELPREINNELEHKSVIYYHDYPVYNDYIEMLRSLSPTAKIIALEGWNPPAFPVSGSDLTKKGFVGKQIGYTMGLLREKWIKSDFSLSKDELLEDL